MTNLICNVHNCTHNSSNMCCKDGIQVGGKSAVSSVNTCCESFEEKTGAFTNSIESPKFSLNITCEAENCTYNKCKMCEAEDISIEGGAATSQTGTECASFVSRL
ncbi:DUF1540 domain-containing protein [Clostridium celatum]|uniref:DUF1540 domain-containing protein n=1 Tax=Clostridium celatum TaxID=36834 RepID=UPI00319DB934